MTDMHANRSQPPVGERSQAASVARDGSGHAPTGVSMSKPDPSCFLPGFIIGLAAYFAWTVQAVAWHGCTHSGEYPIVLYGLNGQTHAGYFKGHFFGGIH